MPIPKIGEEVPMDYNPGADIPPIGTELPLIDPNLLAVKELPKESVAQSAIQDFKKNVDGVLAIGQAAGNIFASGDENTLLKIGKYFEDAHEKGTLDDDAWGFVKESVMTPLRNIKADIQPILDDGLRLGTPKAAENILRSPFSFTLDVLSAAGIAKSSVVATKGLASFATSKSMADIGKRVAKAEAIGEAKTAEELAEELGDAFTNLDDKIRMAAENAKAVLPKDPALGFSPKQVTGLLDNAIDDIGAPISDASTNAVDALSKYKNRITKAYKNKNVSAPELKQIIMDLDDDIDWNTPKSNRSNKAIKQLRHEVDTMLKTKFPNYGERMVPLSDLIGTREDASRLLKVVRRQGEWEVPDMAVSRMDRLFKGGYGKKKSIDILSKFGEKSGLDIAGEMELSTFRKKFNAPSPQATRTTLTGALVGGWLGGPKGMASGAAVGKALDKYGGMAISKTVDLAPSAFRTVGAIAESVPTSAIGVAPSMQFSRTALDIKSRYKSGEITKEEAAAQLRASGEFK